jgi:hypothetical protein
MEKFNFQVVNIRGVYFADIKNAKALPEKADILYYKEKRARVEYRTFDYDINETIVVVTEY